MVWDEGNAIVRADKIAHWVGGWLTAERPSPLDRRAIAHGWPYTTRIEGHPAFYGIVIAAGQAIVGGYLDPLSAARFGPIILFASAAGAMFYRVGRDYGLAAAFGAVGALVLLPRMFAHAHFASFDGPLVSCWILAWALFDPALRRRWVALVWGAALGMTLSAKATGWLAPLAFLAWTLLYRDRAAAVVLALGLPAALAVFYVLNPPLWHEPIAGLMEFYRLNLDRAGQGLNISTQFLGRMHNLNHPLPWYNTLVWTAVTVPVGILFLATVGLVSVARHWRTDKAGTLVLANWLVLMAARALPLAPPHDGVRLFLPCFAFLAVLSAVGCDVVVRVVSRLATIRGWSQRTGLAGVVLLYIGSATSLLWYAPQWLSYYNVLIGGLPGASALGMEPTYYWDGLDCSVLDWLDRHTESTEKVRFGAGSTENLRLMRRWNVLRQPWELDAPGEYRWYVLQHRPSAWQKPDRWLIDHEKPALQKRIRSGGWGPWRLDVPIVAVYAYSQYVGAVRLNQDVCRERQDL